MSNPNQPSSASDEAQQTNWGSLSRNVEFSPISISTDGISKITLSDAPMGEGRQDKRVDVADASGAEKRTSNLMLGYNKRGVKIGETYLSIEEFRKKALECLEEDGGDKTLFFIRKDTGQRFAEPRAVVDDMIVAITGAGPETSVSDNPNIPNQDARSVEFRGPNGETQRGVFMLGKNGIQMPNGTYAETTTIKSVVDNYAKATKKESPIEPGEGPLPPTKEIPTDQEPKPDKPEAEVDPDEEFHQATINLAELYAKNRRLFVSPNTRKEFEAAKQRYQRLFAERLSRIAHTEYDTQFKGLSSDIQTMASELAAENIRELTDFVGGDLEHPNKTPEEIEAKREELRQAAEAKMREKYPDMVVGVETATAAKMIEESTKMRAELEEATIDALDNGTACRKAVSKIITNKWVRRGLTAAAAAGLAVAAIGIGRGVANGSLAVSLGYTAGGIIAGAIRGGLSGALMSRQSSKTSAIHNYGAAKISGNENEAGEDNADEPVTAESLAAKAMSDYTTANRADLRSNRVKTAIATGIGAAVGAAASGIHVENIVRSTTTEQVQTGTSTEEVQIGTTTERVQTGSIPKEVQTGTTTEQIQTGTTPVEYEVDLTKIDIKKGSGMRETFTDLGGDPAKISEAIKIAHEFDSEYGMVPGSNGSTAGVGGQVGKFAHTYPGTIDTWPKQARDYITKVAQKWAEAGLIESTKTGGEPIFTTIETPVYSAFEIPVFSTIEKPVFITVESPVFSTIEKTVIKYLPNLFYTILVQAEAAATAGIVGGAISGTGQTTGENK